jgi:purine-nucleoside phosphorylase
MPARWVLICINHRHWARATRRGHQLPLPAPSAYSEADAHLTRLAREALTAAGLRIQSGATWTTDAPFRETEQAIDAAMNAGILAVEMEAAALYAFATTDNRRCFA